MADEVGVLGRALEAVEWGLPETLLDPKREFSLNCTFSWKARSSVALSMGSGCGCVAAAEDEARDLPGVGIAVPVLFLPGVGSPETLGLRGVVAMINPTKQYVQFFGIHKSVASRLSRPLSRLYSARRHVPTPPA